MKFATAILLAIAASVNAEGDAPKLTGPLGKCDFANDCDDDDQCAAGLLCADDHKKELKDKGYDTRTANCGPGVPGSLWEVCFDTSLLYSGGGFGDPHFQTYDGTKYSFHGQCDLVMANAPSFANNLGLTVHARTTIIDDWSLISEAAIRIGDDVFEITNEDSHYFNGAKDTELPITLAGKYTVTKSEETIEKTNIDGEKSSDRIVEYSIDLGKGEIKVSNFRKMLAVRVNAYLPGVEGMLGLQGTKGMVGREQQSLEDANEMGAQWQVRDNEPMLFHEVRAPQFPETCTLPSVKSRRLRQSESEVKRANEACANVRDSLRPFCVDDVLMSGDINMAHTYDGFNSAIAF